MSYIQWFEQHAKKHEAIMKKLESKSDDDIIEYFEYDNMSKYEKDFCPLYAKNEKCHDTKYLNCYLCACSNFRFNDEGFDVVKKKTRYSFCSIDSKDGTIFEGENYIHQNCSNCTVPHTKAYVKQHFNRNWKTIMKKCLSSVVEHTQS